MESIAIETTGLTRSFGARPAVDNLTCGDPHALFQAESEHLFRRFFPHWNQESVADSAQPGKQRLQSGEARQIGCGRGDLKGSPMNHGLGFEHEELFAFANSDMFAASKQKAEVPASEDPPAG